jgi:hypothetical protein
VSVARGILKSIFGCRGKTSFRSVTTSGIRYIVKGLAAIVSRWFDTRWSTYLNSALPFSGGLRSFFDCIESAYSDVLSEQLAARMHYFMKHQFNLLGSHWQQVQYEASREGWGSPGCEERTGLGGDGESRFLKGRINESNLEESLRIWGLVDDNYIAIDWQLDFKSHYRWSENTWYLDIPHGHKLGVDIKVPWELARMQHLPEMALAYGVSKKKDTGFGRFGALAREFQNQVLDFISTNPPRFGVNWRSPMDVGIRAVNWLVAYDLFQVFGAEYGEPFKKEFLRSIYQHGRHIVNNLEWNDTLRANHYLSNIVSILYIAAYMPGSREIDAWLALSIQELINEVEAQFHTEGSNFEASTSYHRLSAEFVIYATALILGLPEEKMVSLKGFDYRVHRGDPKLKRAPIELYPLKGTKQFTPFPDWYFGRLEKIAEFSMNITKPNGHICQIGDNDSGRFLKFQPIFQKIKARRTKTPYGNPMSSNGLEGESPFGDEDVLNHRHLVAAMNGLFNRPDFAQFVGPGWIETDIVEKLSKGVRLPSSERPDHSGVGGKRVKRSSDGIQCLAYPDFGIYLYRSKDVYLAVRCGAVGQNGNGGHSHNDQLSFELNIQGRDFIVDGGSFLYTPVPHIRNEFRSTRAHNTLFLQGFEQNSWEEGLRGLFSLKDKGQSGIVNYNHRYFEGEYIRDRVRHVRSFELGNGRITITDYLSTEFFGELNFNLSPDTEIIQIDREDREEYFLQLLNNGVTLGLLLTGFKNVEVTEGCYSNCYGHRISNHRLRCDRARSQTLAKIMLP